MQKMWFHSTASKTKAMEIALLNKKKNNQNGNKKPDQCEYMRLSCRLSVCLYVFVWHNVQIMLDWLWKNEEETEEEKESKDDRTVTVTNYVFTKCNIVYVNIHIDALLKAVFGFVMRVRWWYLYVCMYLYVCHPKEDLLILLPQELSYSNTSQHTYILSSETK